MTVETKSYLFNAKIGEALPKAVGGKGNFLILEDPETKERREVFDAMGGAAVVGLGHKDEDIIKEMAEAAKDCTYTYPFFFTNHYAEELAKFYIENSRKGAFSAASFTGSGSESNENAMKIVKQYYIEKGEPERNVFVGRKQAYHGYTIGALSLGHNTRRDMYADILLPASQTPKVSQVYPYRHQKEGESIDQYTNRLLTEVEDTFIDIGPKKVAAFVCETLTGSTYGTTPSTPGYLAGLRKICDKYGVLLWLDEVMCGTGRSSKYGGLNCWESFDDFDGPDIQTIGKTLGGGFVTIAGILLSPKIQDAYLSGSKFLMGAQTYHQHSFNCRVALAVQKKTKRLNLTKNAYDVGEKMGAAMKLLAKTCSVAGDVRGSGAFWSVEIVKDKGTKEPFPPELKVGVKTTAKALENGLIVMGMGGTMGDAMGDHVSVAPSFTITEDDAQFIAVTLMKSLNDVADELKASNDL